MAPFRSLLLLSLFLFLGATSVIAETFLESLSPEKRRELGLDQLTPAQLGALGSAIEAYRKDGATIAANSAVEDYRRRDEPSAISRALELFKLKQAEERQERITAMIVGPFSGWDGRTQFVLDNGQVWRQNRADTYITKRRTDVPVVLYKSSSGYWRLRILDDEGAWVTVVRIK